MEVLALPAYAEAVGVYLAYQSVEPPITINAHVVWSQSREQSVNLSQTGDSNDYGIFAEVNPFRGSWRATLSTTTVSVSKTINDSLD